MRAFGIALAACIGACSANHTKHPAEFDDCIPPPDAACASLAAVSGGASAEGDAGNPAARGNSGTGPVSCGTVAVSTMNPTCQPCIVGPCCTAGEKCTANCQAILACTQTCTMGDSVCVQTCESGNYSLADLTAYRDFVTCLASSCPGCPMLPQ